MSTGARTEGTVLEEEGIDAASATDTGVETKEEEDEDKEGTDCATIGVAATLIT